MKFCILSSLLFVLFPLLSFVQSQLGITYVIQMCSHTLSNFFPLLSLCLNTSFLLVESSLSLSLLLHFSSISSSLFVNKLFPKFFFSNCRYYVYESFLLKKFTNKKFVTNIVFLCVYFRAFVYTYHEV